MKQMRKILKLLVPTVLMHRWLKGRYGINISIPGETEIQRALVGLSPYVVSVILQQRKQTDRRVIKYFLPYGKMREHVWCTYGMKVGDPKRDGGLVGKMRSVLPYGLILWWDSEDERIAREVAARKARPASARPASASAATQGELTALKAQIESLRRERAFREYTIEIVALRSALQGRRPSVSVVLTGCYEADAVRRSLEEHLKNSIYEMELLVAYRFGDADVAAVVNEFARYDSRIKTLDATGTSLAELRAKAIAAASGDFIAFLNVNDRYSDRQRLELVVLTAAVEKAKVCCGKVWTKVAGKVVYPDQITWERRGFLPSMRPPVPAGLPGALFDRAWLVSTDLAPFASTFSDDALFLQVAERLAGRVFCLGQTAGVAGRDTTGDTHTEAERAMDALRGMLAAARFADRHGSDDLKAFLANRVLADRVRMMRELAWGVDAASARPLLDELSALLPDGKIEENVLTPLVSVVVPAYNVEKYLGQTLDSLVNQSLASIEIIVVDDGSTDGTPAICDRYAAQYANVRALHRRNGGRSAARNSGLELVRGKYVGFVDGDDFVDLKMFETMSDMLESAPTAMFAMCGVQVEFLYEASEEYRMWAQRYFDFAHVGLVELTPGVACEVNCSVCNKLYRCDSLREAGIRFPLGMDNEDAVFSFFVMGKANHLVVADERFYHYLRNDKGIMAKQVENFAQEGSLPDALTKAMPLIAEYLVRDDRRDLLGAFFRRFCGAASGFKGQETARCVAQLLHKVGYFYNMEFLDRRDLGWVKNQLSNFQNFECSDLPSVSVEEGDLPHLRARPGAVANPVVSVIIPVYNQERYLTYCLESVRKQTLASMEILCIDDGSFDHSLSLLNELAECDGRIRVFHRENSGAGATRNFGLRQAVGKYIVFVDADDYIELDYLETVCSQMERDELDMCLIDLECFEYDTRKSVPHYWALKNQIRFYPALRVFTYSDLKQYRCMTGPCTAVWRRGFLLDNNVEFPLIKNGEDSIFWMRAMPFARRIGLNQRVFYHYRRGNPTSAVSRLHGEAGSSNALVTIRHLLEQWESMRSALSPRSRALMAGRLALEVSYHCKLSGDVLRFMQREGFRRFGLHLIPGVTETAPDWAAYEAFRSAPCEADGAETPESAYRAGLPTRVRALIEEIERERMSSRKDLYLITGQLNTTTNAPIDSWLFFRWLQAQGIPSRYVLWRKHEWYPRLKASGELKDVIFLEGNGVDDYEFLFKCRDVLPRCKVFAQENGALIWRLRKWFYYLPECPYVYLEHGIKYLKYSDHLGKFLSTFNAINNTSEFERDLIERNLPGYVDNGIKPVCFVGGLPRLGSLKDERKANRDTFVVFVMFTWREAFNAGQDVLVKSAYYKGLQALLSEKNQARLASSKVRLVVAAHHHLVNHIRDLSLGSSVEIVPQDQIASWKGRADCCLTDYSSISFDFAFLEKPVVFWCPDREDPILTPNDYNELLVAEEREGSLVNMCRSATEVIERLEAYARSGFELEPEKKVVMSKFFTHRTDICRHLYDALEHLAC